MTGPKLMTEEMPPRVGPMLTEERPRACACGCAQSCAACHPGAEGTMPCRCGGKCPRATVARK